MLGSTVTVLDDLAALLPSATVRDGPVWLPALGQIASAFARERLKSKIALLPGSYGTGRVRRGLASAERIECGRIVAPSAFGRYHPIIVEVLERDVAAKYEDLGLILALGEAAGSPAVIARLEVALHLIGEVHSLAQTIGRVLDVLHVAVPEGAEFDVSYSDPEIPFSIFVGVADDASSCADLRLAEGIVHESMHLHLSLIEASTALIEPGGPLLPSPWRDEPRPVGGVLHGAFVFAVVREFMAELMRLSRPTGPRALHIERRVDQTGAEVAAAISSLRSAPGLTLAGRTLTDVIAHSIKRTCRPSASA